METNEHLESGSATPSVRAREVFKKRVLFFKEKLAKDSRMRSLERE